MRAVLLKSVRSRPDTARNSTTGIERSETNQLNINYMLSAIISSRTRRTWEKNEKICPFTLCRNLYDYKLQNVAPHRNDIITSFALIPVSTDPDGVRVASGRLRTAFSRTRRNNAIYWCGSPLAIHRPQRPPRGWAPFGRLQMLSELKGCLAVLTMHNRCTGMNEELSEELVLVKTSKPS